jgi:hypothetical protein
MMFRIWIGSIFLLLWTTGGRADACSIVVGPQGRPTTDVVRLSGVVTGYGAGAGSVRGVHQPPGLRVRIEEVVSGGLQFADAEVYPLSLGPDCGVGPSSPIVLARWFRVGTRVVVQGELLPWPEAVGRLVVAVDVTKKGFVQPVPDSAKRTPEGDLDFEHLGSLRDFQFIRFEFDRVVLTLATSLPRERRARLRNLVFFPGFQNVLDARTLYRQLLAESGITDSEQRDLLSLFDDRMPKAR